MRNVPPLYFLEVILYFTLSVLRFLSYEVLGVEAPIKGSADPKGLTLSWRLDGLQKMNRAECPLTSMITPYITASQQHA